VSVSPVVSPPRAPPLTAVELKATIIIANPVTILRISAGEERARTARERKPAVAINLSTLDKDKKFALYYRKASLEHKIVTNLYNKKYLKHYFQK
jgi:hypothetical protein